MTARQVWHDYYGEDRDRIIRFLHIILVAMLSAAILVTGIGLVNGWVATPRMGMLIVAGALVSLALVRRERVLAASILAVSVLMAGLGYAIYTGNGIHDVGVVAFAAAVIMSSLLFHNWLYYLFSSLPVLILGGITLLRDANGIESLDRQLFSEYLVLVATFMVITIAIRLITRYERHSLHQARDNARRYRHIFENIQDVFFEHTSEGVILDISPSVERLPGMRRDVLIGTRLTDLFADPGHRRQYGELLMGEGVLGNWETRLRRGDGAECHVSINARLLDDGDGRPAKVVGSIRDITHTRRLEEQFRQAQKMEAVGRLAGGVAHDFNNLLTVISGYATMLKQRGDVVNGSVEDVNRIETAAGQASRLTRQLLLFSRKEIARPERVNINAVVEECHRLYSRLIGEDIRVELDLSPEPLDIVADRQQFEQILLNLLINARDAIDARENGEGERRIAIETRRAPDASGDSGEGPGAHRIFLAVTDNGIGMDAATRERIFEPFFTTKEAGKGTGLGLSTVYGIVQQSGGTIRVESVPGQGSTFHICWPAADDGIEAAPSVEGGETAQRGSETIVLVEDEPTVRDFTRTALENQGYAVTAFDCAEAALPMLRNPENAVDLLMTDLVMPGMDGFALARTIEPLRADTRILFTSGYTDSPVLRERLISGTAHFLPKPYDVYKLATTIRSILDASVERD